MNAVNSQLTTILNSFATRTRLVYNTSDNCFYSVGSIKNLSKDYVTQSEGIQQKIGEFIKQNSDKLDFNISDSFRKELEERIKKIDSKTSGILAFFLFLFNPNSRQQLLKSKQGLEDLNNTIKAALEELKGYDIEENDIGKEEKELVNGTPSPFKPNQSTPSKQSGNVTPGTPKTIPAPTTPLPPSPRVPPPPPPPPMNAPKPRAILLPGEPKHLPFEQFKYKSLSREAIQKQIDNIESYVEKLTATLVPLEQSIKELHTLRDEIDLKRESLKSLDAPLEECRNNLKRLKDGQKKNETVFLYFREGKIYYQVPFYPDNTHELIENHMAIKQPAPPTAPPVPTKPTASPATTLPTSPKTPLLPPPKHLNTSDDAFEDVDAEDEQVMDAEAYKKIMHSGLSKKFGLSNAPSTPDGSSSSTANNQEKGLFHRTLKLSEAIKAQEALIKDYEEHFNNLQNELEKLETKLKKLSEKKILKNDPTKLSDVEKIYEAKIKLRDEWKKCKDLRKKFLTEKQTTSLATRNLKKKTSNSELTSKVPEYQHYTVLPTVLLLKLNNAFNLHPDSENYSQTIWSVLKPQLPEGAEVKTGEASTPTVTTVAGPTTASTA